MLGPMKEDGLTCSAEDRASGKRSWTKIAGGSFRICQAGLSIELRARNTSGPMGLALLGNKILLEDRSIVLPINYKMDVVEIGFVFSPFCEWHPSIFPTYRLGLNFP